MIKQKICDACYKVYLKEGVKCEAYFSDRRYNKYKVTIRYGADLYHFKTYKDALNFVQS